MLFHLNYGRNLGHCNFDTIFCVLQYFLFPSVCFVRLLEEGKVTEADKRKDEVEEKQRERRKEMGKRGEEHTPRFFR